MAITFSWSSSIINKGTETAPRYYKVGIWYNDGVESGTVEIPCDVMQVQKVSDSTMIATIEDSLVDPNAD